MEYKNTKQKIICEFFEVTFNKANEIRNTALIL